MPMYDRICPDGHQMLDCWERVETAPVPCKECGKVTERAWLSKPSAVIGDDIPGGILIRHGICNEDGSPRRYYTKSSIAAEAKRKGLAQAVRHVGEQGSDKSRHTVAWTGIPMAEDERLKAWHAHEAQLQAENAKGTQ